MIWSPYSRRWAPEDSQLRKLIVGQWLLVTLSVITGRVANLALERLLLLVLKPVLPAALPAASGWPWLWAIRATGVISLRGGPATPIDCCWRPCRCECHRDVVANVWPLKIWIPAVSVVVVGLLAWLLSGSRCCGRCWPGRWCSAAAALVGWGLLWLLKRLTLKHFLLWR